MKVKFVLILTESRRELIAKTDYNSLEEFHQQAEEQLGERIINLSDGFVGDPETVKVDLHVWDPYWAPNEWLDEGDVPEPTYDSPDDWENPYGDDEPFDYM